MHAFLTNRFPALPSKRHLGGVAAVLACWALATGAQAQETFKLGVVAFLSGPAAKSFGKPAWTAPRR